MKKIILFVALCCVCLDVYPKRYVNQNIQLGKNNNIPGKMQPIPTNVGFGNANANYLSGPTA